MPGAVVPAPPTTAAAAAAAAGAPRSASSARARAAASLRSAHAPLPPPPPRAAPAVAAPASRAPPRRRASRVAPLAALLLLLLPLLALWRQASPRARRTQQPPPPPSQRRRVQQQQREDYERRLRGALAAGRARPAARFVRWLHVPKTGTSLVNTLVRWGCPDAPRDVFVVPAKERPAALALSHASSFSWDWLFANRSGRAWLRRHCARRLVTTHPVSGRPQYALYIHKPLQQWEVPHAVAMFRIPKQRMYSNYLHLNLHFNASRTPKEPLYAFLHRSEFWSQHAKLLLGRSYRDQRLLTERDALRAVALVADHIAFVGLTEQFELSCRLFHALFGGVPHRLQFENVRPSLQRYKRHRLRNESFRYDEAQFRDWVDSADEMVYAAAQLRFWNDVARLKSEIEKDGLGEVHVLPPEQRYQTHVLRGAPGTDRRVSVYNAASSKMARTSPATL